MLLSVAKASGENSGWRSCHTRLRLAPRARGGVGGSRASPRFEESSSGTGDAGGGLEIRLQRRLGAQASRERKCWCPGSQAPKPKDLTPSFLSLRSVRPG